MSSWKDTILNQNTSIKDAILNLEKSNLQIVLVVDDKNFFHGTLTDGDIRRAILKNPDLNVSIKTAFSRNAICTYKPLKNLEALKLMNQKDVNHIPHLDHDKKIIGLYQRSNLNDEVINRPNYMLIMAGGFGKRLRPYTSNCPKPMLEISGKPILEHIILNAKEKGFINFIISLHYMGEVIEDYFKDGSSLGVKINYLKESKPLGTAGAISLIDLSINDSFVVTNGDVLTDIDYGNLIDFHIKNNAFATMAVRQHELQNPFGVVKTMGMEIVDIEEKPINVSYINAGVYVFKPLILEHLKKGKHCDMPDLFKKINKNNLKSYAYPIHEQWMDIGNPTDLNNANKVFDEK